MAPPADDTLWFKDAVIYQLHIRAFADSDGDGIGDFEGLIGKLDYLAELGVTALWVLPFYPSPLRDDGYDIADYDNVNPTYGTLRSFRRFLREAHARKLRVITELVINHTSDEHPWFQRARRAAKGSPHRDYYVWSDTPQRYSEARVIFEDFETSNWTWDPVAGQYFWHRFYSHQPDLNFDNPAVRAAVFRAMDRWLGMGVDGVRLDAIPYLYEREGTNCENLPETHEFLQQLRAHVDTKFPGRMLLAEANQWPEDAVEYFGDGDECHMSFHFPLMPRLYMALEMEDSRPIIDILAQTPPIPDTAQWAMFLRNHDELTLEMVTDDERVQMRRAYAPDPRMRINLGIRRRLAPLVQNDRRRIELLNALLFSMPGTPVIYYGDEIGMGDNVYLPDRDGLRTPMQWNSGRNAGFSEANPHQLYLPVISDPQYHFETVNVESQQANPTSLWWWMRDIIATRRRHSVFGRGSMTFIDTDNPRVLAFVRSAGDEHILVVANVARHAQQVRLDLGAFAGAEPVELFGGTVFERVGADPYLLSLGAYAFMWFVLGRSPTATRTEPPSIVLAGRSQHLDFTDRDLSDALEDALRIWLPRQRWFRQGSPVRDVDIRRMIPLAGKRGGDSGAIAIVAVTFTNAETAAYVVPLAYGSRAVPVDLPADRVIATRTASQVFFDGMASAAVAGALVRLAWERPQADDSLGGWHDGRQPRIDATVPVELIGVGRATTVSRLGDVVIEVRHQLAGGVADDPETVAALRRVGFTAVAPVLARVDLLPTQGEATTLAVVRPNLPHDADAASVLASRLRAYLETARALPTHAKAPVIDDLLVILNAEDRQRVSEAYGIGIDMAAQLGSVVGGLHAGLLSIHPPTRFTRLYQRALYQTVASALTAALHVVRDLPLGTSADGVAEVAARLDDADVEAARSRVMEVRHHLVDVSRCQIHGNLHLGRVVYDGSQFVLLDIAGDLTLPVESRRIPRSPLRDVVTLHASLTEITRQVVSDVGGDAAVRARSWLRAASAVGWSAYVETLRDAGKLDLIVPADAAETRLLIDIYRLDAACRAVVETAKRGTDSIVEHVSMLAEVVASVARRAPVAKVARLSGGDAPGDALVGEHIERR